MKSPVFKPLFYNKAKMMFIVLSPHGLFFTGKSRSELSLAGNGTENHYVNTNQAFPHGQER